MAETFNFENPEQPPIEAVYVAPEREDVPQASGPLIGEIAEVDQSEGTISYAEVDLTVPAEPVFGDQGPTAETETPAAAPSAEPTPEPTPEAAPVEETPANG